MSLNLATIFLTPARTVSYPSGPGSRIDFRGGTAVARDLPTVVWALRRPDCTVTPDPRHVDFVPDWVAACGEHAPAVAKVTLPDGAAVPAAAYLDAAADYAALHADPVWEPPLDPEED